MLDYNTSLTSYPLSPPKLQKSHHQTLNPIISVTKSRCHISFRVKCCREAKDYYQLLGVSVDSTPKDIKKAYRKLQKKYHPDIAGQKGHEHTLMLNEAYQALMRDDLRRRYDLSSLRKREGFSSNISGLGYSSWSGPIRPHALFVDENKCIGCRECVHYAGNTFVMDDSNGSARVKVQFGDQEEDIEVAMESCPMDCIHWVESEELPLLEFLTRPQRKEAHGIFGGGWERPRDIFSALKSYGKQLKRQQEEQDNQSYNGPGAVEDETPAQAKARYDADLKLRLEGIFVIWGRLKELFGLEKNRENQ